MSRQKKIVFYDPDDDVSIEDKKIHNIMDEQLSQTDFGKFTVQKGQIVNGKVARIKEGELLIGIGGKYEGIVGGAELQSEDIDVASLKIGEEVMVYVVNPSDDKGQMVLSIRKTGTARKWFKLREAKKTNEIIEVEVIEANSGGVIVETGGLRGFIPTSQLDSSRIFSKKDYSVKSDVMQTVQSKLASLIGEKIYHWFFNNGAGELFLGFVQFGFQFLGLRDIWSP